MAKSNIQAQPPTFWSSIRPATSTFLSMTNDHGFDGLTIQNVPNLNDLINLSQDDTFGIILAYKYLEKPLFENSDSEESVRSDGDSDSISLICKPYENYCVTTALMDTLQSMKSDMEKVDQSPRESVERPYSIKRGVTLESIPEVEETNDLDVADEPETVDLKDKDAYHFSSYIFKNSYICELNCMNRYPTKLEYVYKDEDENWLEMLQVILEDKIDSESLEAHIIAIIHNPRQRKEEELKMFTTQIENLENELKEHEVYPFKSSASTDPQPCDLSSKGRELLRKKQTLERKVIQLKQEMEYDQNEKSEKSEEEQNDSREINYVDSSPSPSPFSSPSPPLSFTSTHETLSTNDDDEDTESAFSKENDREENAIVSELEEKEKDDVDQDSSVPELTSMKDSDIAELTEVHSAKGISCSLDENEVEYTAACAKENKTSVKRDREEDNDEDHDETNNGIEFDSLKHPPAKKRFNLHK